MVKRVVNKIITSGVDEISPVPVIHFDGPMTPKAMAEFQEQFRAAAGQPLMVIPEMEIHTEDTMRKVREALASVGLAEAGDGVITAMQNKGILFRERG
jgi:hypothetical protein